MPQRKLSHLGQERFLLSRGVEVLGNTTKPFRRSIALRVQRIACPSVAAAAQVIESAVRCRPAQGRQVGPAQ
ncbi:MAG: hypothetical protein ACSHXH_09920 [Marivita sp.]|uniref:hypothetical protein n=1 Tax=Marivita sp. TaxID=2003365 RepID=UPI003EF5343F